MPYNVTTKVGPGQYVREFRATCRNCEGSGLLNPPIEVQHVCPIIRCPVCNGSGKVQIVKHISITVTPAL